MSLTKKTDKEQILEKAFELVLRKQDLQNKLNEALHTYKGKREIYLRLQRKRKDDFNKRTKTYRELIKAYEMEIRNVQILVDTTLLKCKKQ